MTKADKTVKRETYSSVHERGVTRPLVIEISSTFVTIRPKGIRKGYTVSMSQIYSMGARNQAEANRRDRLAKRAAAKKARA